METRLNCKSFELINNLNTVAMACNVIVLFALSPIYCRKVARPIETIMKMEFTMGGRNTDAAGK